MRNRSKKRKHSNSQQHVNVRVHHFSSPKERQDLLKNLAVSAEFEMRYRGLLEYYGQDFVAYKLEKPSCQNRNNFLQIISSYMTTHLENNCPISWKKCPPTFWEELISAYYPHLMKVTPDEKEVDTFLHELKNFVKWLDNRSHTSWLPTVEKTIIEISSDLKTCEHVLNALYLRDYPNIHQDNWSPMDDIKKMQQDFEQCIESKDSLYEVTKIIDDTIEITDLNTLRSYHVKGMPFTHLKPGIIIHGEIGRKSEELFYNWYHTECVYPQRGKNFIAV